jgi:hypothetical protein
MWAVASSFALSREPLISLNQSKTQKQSNASIIYFFLYFFYFSFSLVLVIYLTTLTGNINTYSNISEIDSLTNSSRDTSQLPIVSSNTQNALDDNRLTSFKIT